MSSSLLPKRIHPAPIFHQLKIHPFPFRQIAKGQKCHEVRKADRDFKPKDLVFLNEYDPDTKEYSGRFIKAIIGALTEPGEWGLPGDLCVFSLLEIEERGKTTAPIMDNSKIVADERGVHRPEVYRAFFTKKCEACGAPVPDDWEPESWCEACL